CFCDLLLDSCFKFIGRIFEACRVDQHKEFAWLHLHAAINSIPRGAGLIGHDGLLGVDQPVEHARFADVGTSHNRYYWQARTTHGVFPWALFLYTPQILTRRDYTDQAGHDAVS